MSIKPHGTSLLFTPPMITALLITSVMMMGCSPASTDTTRSETDAEVPQPDLQIARQDRLNKVEQLESESRLEEAVALLRQQLLSEPGDTEVIFRIANLTASLGDLESAIQFLDSISADDLEAGLPALGQAADWCMELKDLRGAESRYLKLLEFAPDASIAHRRLAMLFNRQGRRHEAATHIRKLCELGDVRQDELHALVVLSDAMGSLEGSDAEADINAQDSAALSDENNPLDSTDYSPLNSWGRARILFTQRNYSEAAAVLGDSFGNRSDGAGAPEIPDSVFAFYGRVLAEAQEDSEFQNWLKLANEFPQAEEYSEYWSAIGTFLASQQQAAPACRALLEALDRDPTDFRSMNRLHQMLEVSGETELAKRWENRWKANREVLLANNAISEAETPDVNAMDEIASQLSGLGRNAEAVLWKMLESFHRGLDANALNGWNQQREQLFRDQRGFPSREIRLCEMDNQIYPLPDLNQLRTAINGAEKTYPTGDGISEAVAVFKNVASEKGLHHQFLLSTSELESGFAMYHQAGGGVAIIDYDLDGMQDIYFAQGAADAPDFKSKLPNSLFRNSDRNFSEVTAKAQVGDTHYTIGCSTGDWNQDGLPDLITSNIGPNLLMINNGDGTFSSKPIPGSESKQVMPASLAIADLNGDTIPDLFETNYIDDRTLDLRPERAENGEVIEAVGPADFQPAADRIGLNDGTGQILFAELQTTLESNYRGLGLVVTDFNGDGLNEIFVGNDKSPNQLWSTVDNDPSEIQWRDIAMPSGAAFSFDGGGTASMGIASGDFDRSGSLDLHVANFQNENACLYLSQNGFFQDRVAQYRLGVPSYGVLGFGSQSIDFNLDGFLDLAVTNGHIDNYQKMSGDFKQRFQLFRNQNKRFTEVSWTNDSPYATEKHLGRALAKMDFDNDGREDLVVTHINEPSALLRGATESNNHWLQIQLVGVQSERDAIGAKITVRFAEQELHQWITAGDGYLCRNHNLACFGLGAADEVQNIQIDWPTGKSQLISSTTVDQRILVIENQSESFHLPSI
ncbi:MAG: FG-GAP-like repeat-containing protein [Rubripirellula sp.]